VLVATDDERIRQAVAEFGGEAVMTSPECVSGSDRVGEVVAQRAEEVIINVQGDEPLIDPRAINFLIEAFADDPALEMATLGTSLDYESASNPNVVKVVCDSTGFALYFSRSRIPFWRNAGKSDESPPDCWHHIGIYAYRREVLLRYLSLPVGRLETVEKLEQLRALENGIRIKVLEGDWPCYGVDTQEDLDKVTMIISGG